MKNIINILNVYYFTWTCMGKSVAVRPSITHKTQKISSRVNPENPTGLGNNAIYYPGFCQPWSKRIWKGGGGGNVRRPRRSTRVFLP